MRKLPLILNRPAVALWGTAGASILYLLSAGPVFWLIWNVRLPDWVMDVVYFMYAPLISTINKSQVAAEIWTTYARLWVDVNVGRPATPPRPDPVPPPYLVETAGILIGAWLIWNCVRWVNQRGPGNA
jgi:hypothetical protein